MSKLLVFGTQGVLLDKNFLISLIVVGKIFTNIFIPLRLFRQFSSIFKKECVLAEMLSYIGNTIIIVLLYITCLSKFSYLLKF